jgi:hypothetical protein
MATLKVTNIKNESFAGDQLYLKSDGRLGIGTTSPGHKLVISQTNSGGIAAIHLPVDESTILGPYANTYLKMGGNVVLGANGQLDFTTSGTSKLTIKNNGQVAIGSSSTDTSALISIIKDTTEVLADNEPLYNNASPAFLTIYNSNNTGTGEEAGINLVPAGNANGAISIYGKKTGSYSGDLIFRFRSGASTSAERMRIKSDGDIEVGGNLKTNNLPGRNLLFNGAMQIVQRATNATGLSNTNNYPTADRWRVVSSNAGIYTADIMNDGPANTGFRKSFKLSCTTANNAGESNLANADGYLSIEQRLEGYDVQCLKKGTTEAESLSLSFWCKSNQTGTYNVELYDVDNARRVGSQFTVDSDGTWEKKTFTFTGDTTGTLSNDNTDTFRFRVYLAAGNNFRTGTNSGVWAANVANQKAQNNQNLSRTQGNYWMMTGVKLEIGSIVTEYDHKSYGEELDRCLRYYWKDKATNAYHVFTTGASYGDENVYGHVDFPVPMRSSGSDIALGYSQFSDFQILQTSLQKTPTSFLLSDRINQYGGQLFYKDGTGALTTGFASFLRAGNNTDAYLSYDCEL